MEKRRESSEFRVDENSRMILRLYEKRLKLTNQGIALRKHLTKILNPSDDASSEYQDICMSSIVRSITVNDAAVCDVDMDIDFLLERRKLLLDVMQQQQQQQQKDYETMPRAIHTSEATSEERILGLRV